MLGNTASQNEGAPTTIGVIAMLLVDPHGKDFPNSLEIARLEPIEKYIADAGWSIAYADLNYLPNRKRTPAQLAKELIDSGANVVVMCHDCDYADIDEVRRSIDIDATPVIYLGSRKVYGVAPAVFMDNRDGGFQAANHLIEQGCRRFMFFCPTVDEWVNLRANGSADAARAAGLPASNVRNEIGKLSYEELIQSMSNQEAAYRAASELLSEGSELDGVVAGNDEAAFGFMQAAREQGLLAGRDYLIVGFDNLRMSQTVGLTSVAHPTREVASDLMRMLRRMEAGERVNSRVLLPMKLIERSSSMRRSPSRRA